MKATVIFDTCREGSLNMALDSLLLQQLREEEQVFLRFYTWCPALCPLFIPKVAAATTTFSLPVVRRPTGGKAVLHLLDVSYSLLDLLAVLETVFWKPIFLCLRAYQGLELLGIPAEFLPAPLPTKEDPSSCFVHLSGHEVGVAGKKLIGSAQARKPWAFYSMDPSWLNPYT